MLLTQRGRKIGVMHFLETSYTQPALKIGCSIESHLWKKNRFNVKRVHVWNMEELLMALHLHPSLAKQTGLGSFKQGRQCKFVPNDSL